MGRRRTLNIPADCETQLEGKAKPSIRKRKLEKSDVN